MDISCSSILSQRLSNSSFTPENCYLMYLGMANTQDDFICEEQQTAQVTCELCVTHANHRLNYLPACKATVDDSREFLILEAMDNIRVGFITSTSNHHSMNWPGVSLIIFSSASK